MLLKMPWEEIFGLQHATVRRKDDAEEQQEGGTWEDISRVYSVSAMQADERA